MPKPIINTDKLHFDMTFNEEKQLSIAFERKKYF